MQKSEITQNILHRYRYPIILGAIIVLAIFLRVHFLLGIERVDSLKYSQVVYNLLHGHFFGPLIMEAQDRLTFLFPVAIFYKIFGVTEWSSVLWIFMCNIIGIVVIYAIGKLINPIAGLFAAFFAAIYSLEISSGTRMMPDGLNILFVGLPILLFLWGEIKFKQHRLWLYLLAGVAWGVSYYVKINLLVIFPIFVITYCIYKRKLDFGYLLLIAGFACVWLPVGYYFYLNTGSFFLQELQCVYIFKYSYTAFEQLNGYITNLNPPAVPVAAPADAPVYNGFLRQYWDYTLYFLGVVYKNKSIFLFSLLSMGSWGYLLLRADRKKYWLVHILLISALIYLIITNAAAWNNRDRYLTVLTIPFVISIGTVLSLFLAYKKVWISCLMIIFTISIFIFSVYQTHLASEHHNGQTGETSGRFLEAKVAIDAVGLDSFKGNIVTPKGRWQRAINFYLGYDTGYDFFDVATNKTARLRDYAGAGAKLTDDKSKFYFDTDNQFIKEPVIIIKNDTLNNVDGFTSVYQNPRLGFEILKPNP